MTFGADLVQDSGVPARIELGGNQECRAYQNSENATDPRKSILKWQTIGYTPLMLGCEG